MSPLEPLRRVDFFCVSGEERRVDTKLNLISKAFLLAQEGLFPFDGMLFGDAPLLC